MVLGALLLGGCGSPGDTGKAISSTDPSQSSQAQAQKIQANPNMPPQAKAAALQQLQGQHGSAASSAPR